MEKKREEEEEENLEKKNIHDNADVNPEKIEKTIKSTTNTTITTMRRPWEDLPHHLLELFLKAILEPLDRPNLSRVCKAWREFKPPKSCFPELVLGSTTISKFIKGVDGYQIRTCLGSSHGWLIIRIRKTYKHREDLYYLLNIYTKDIIQLPVLWDHYPGLPQICFSSSPTDPDCIALMFDLTYRGFLISKRGWNKWIKSDCKFPFYSKPEPEPDVFEQDFIYATFHFEGNFYALTYGGNIVAIDINVSALLHHNPTAAPTTTTTLTVAPTTTTLTVLPVNSIFPTVGCKRIGFNWIQSSTLGYTRICFDWFLIESLGKLLAVRLYRREKHEEIINLDVLELDFKTMSWFKVKNLPGDQVLFVSFFSSFSISRSEIGMSSNGGGDNCIYVSDHVLGKIHRYDMHNQEMIVCTGYPPTALDRYRRLEFRMLQFRRLWVKPTFV